MVSNQKRSRYVSESTTDEDMDYAPNNQNKPARKPTRTPKCFSKNALMARENRLKKKMYISSLENQVSSLKNDNKKLTAVVDNQSFMLNELKKEVRYLKSVISNSDSIGKLIQSINSCSGMGVTSSIDNKLTASTRAPVMEKTTHPWKEPEKAVSVSQPWEEQDQVYRNYPTPDSTNSYYSSPEIEELNSDGLLKDLDLSLGINDNEILNMFDEKVLETPLTPFTPVDDHNYHYPVKNEQNVVEQIKDDVGVCLHVRKNKVSLEFCPSCCENALQSWRPT